MLEFLCLWHACRPFQFLTNLFVYPPCQLITWILKYTFLRVCFSQNNISREAQTMILIDHPNVLKSHCSFVSDHNLWVVMPYMAGGSCLHILKAAYPDGFEEVVIATVLREVLKGLEYLHHHGHIHRDVKVSTDNCSFMIYYNL